MFRPGATELIVIFLIVLVLFGSRRLPEIGKGLGKGIQNFRKSLKGDDEIDVTPEKSSATHGDLPEDHTAGATPSSEKVKDKV